MKAAEADILLVPGFTGAGPVHWLSRWQKGMKTARRVDLPNRDAPDLPAWTDTLVKAVNTSGRPVVLVAHSLGVLAVAHAAAQFREDRVAGAFMVAAPSAEWVLMQPDIDPAFAAVPDRPLPFTGMLVASRNDEACRFDHAEKIAGSWAVELVDAGDAGHINTASGHGPWPEGALRFARFLGSLKPSGV